MAASEQDALTTTQSMLSGNWNASNTGGITPSFLIASEQPPRMDYAMQTQAHILIYLSSHTIDPNGLGSSYVTRTVDRVSVDIRTKVSRNALRLIYLECKRIFALNVHPTDGTFLELTQIGFTDYTTVGFYRYVFDIYLKNWVVQQG